LRNKNNCRLFQGFESLVWASLLGGAHGAIVALASVAPALFVRLYECAMEGNIAQIQSLQRRVLSLCRLLSLTGASTDGSFFAGLKAALEVLGICGRTLSPPFSELPLSKMADVEALLKENQILQPV
jgi:dihydrodipicolinate synthase/N-acetylneuraminate lyase